MELKLGKVVLPVKVVATLPPKTKKQLHPLVTALAVVVGEMAIKHSLNIDEWELNADVKENRMFLTLECGRMIK